MRDFAVQRLSLPACTISVAACRAEALKRVLGEAAEFIYQNRNKIESNE
jgi:hypothetical protein